MPFCPKCRVEYREGFTMCSDCKIPLVGSLNKLDLNDVSDDTYSAFADSESISDVIGVNEDDFNTVDVSLDSLEYQGDTIKEVDNDKKSEPNKSEKKPEKNENQEALNMVVTEEEHENIMRKFSAPSKEYVSKEEKAKENFSTGIMLIVMGVLGCVFIALLMLGFLPLKVSGTVSYIIDGILFCFFGMFVYFGISSIIKTKKLKSEASEEEDSNAKFEKWFEDTFTKEFVDSDIDISDDSQMNFFKRNAKIKYLVFKQYPDIDEDYVDTVIDKYYEGIFE